MLACEFRKFTAPSTFAQVCSCLSHGGHGENAHCFVAAASGVTQLLFAGLVPPMSGRWGKGGEASSIDIVAWPSGGESAITDGRWAVRSAQLLFMWSVAYRNPVCCEANGIEGKILSEICGGLQEGVSKFMD